ncbi:protein kinase domain-containing protein, partial [Alkalinema pantanalense CENA528]|uniref:protein kinase domain-containing protein n=1 Tax=Alkalinema pantanalense TaxID=1620705 RepID=UPI003D6E0090
MPLLAPLSTGLVLENRYEVAQFLGYGGFGRTYLARDRHRFNELCVLKEFAPQISEPSILRKAEELFQREAGTLYQLRHPKIPEFRALLSIRYQGQDALLLVEQFIAGQSYETWIDRGNRLTEAEAIQFLLDMLPILSYIHDRGVIHRDIAPDNLIREQTSGKPFLIDFGSVRQVATTALKLSGSPGMGTQIHKPGFSPPEQLRGEVFPSTDLYSLAVTTLVLLTGKSPMELYNDHQAQWHWRSFAQVSPALGNLLDRLLSHSPRDRYSSAREVQTLLQSLPQRSTPANSIPPNPAPQ